MRRVIELKDKVEKQVEGIYGPEGGLDVHGYMSVSVSLKNKRVYVALSCWGEPRFWTKRLISQIELCDLQFLHIEPTEESTATGVFEIE